jgi:hypothetical protein
MISRAGRTRIPPSPNSGRPHDATTSWANFIGASIRCAHFVALQLGPGWLLAKTNCITARQRTLFRSIGTLCFDTHLSVVLAMLKLRQHEAIRNQQGLNPLDDSGRAQYWANCLRASSARAAAAMAKATVMRLAGNPSLPAIEPVRFDARWDHARPGKGSFLREGVDVKFSPISHQSMIAA